MTPVSILNGHWKESRNAEIALLGLSLRTSLSNNLDVNVD